jgi:2'-5' RNA ligase
MQMAVSGGAREVEEDEVWVTLKFYGEVDEEVDEEIGVNT